MAEHAEVHQLRQLIAFFSYLRYLTLFPVFKKVYGSFAAQMRDMATRTPIKRSKELVKLSSEHHEALMFSWKVKTGISNGTEIERIINYILHFYEAELKPHFEKEEQYVFPLLPEDNLLRTKAELQHDDLNDLKSSLYNREGDVLATITDFNKLLEDHIRFEERELLPLIEQLTDHGTLAEVSEKIKTPDRKPVTHWQDQFWVKG